MLRSGSVIRFATIFVFIEKTPRETTPLQFAGPSAASHAADTNGSSSDLRHTFFFAAAVLLHLATPQLW